jgi:ABC-2 type transport system ATP-binding protein
VTIIRRGRTVQSGTLTELRHLTRTTVSAGTRRPVTGLEGRPGVHDVVSDDGRVTFDVDGDHMEAVMSHLAEFGISSLTSHPPTLEELFLRHYGDELTDAGLGQGHIGSTPP